MALPVLICDDSSFARKQMKRALPDNWDIDLILGADGVEISIHLSNETKDWCYENNLPIIPGKQKRDWLYNKVSLPSYDDYEQVDRETFDKRFKRACMGY